MVLKYIIFRRAFVEFLTEDEARIAVEKNQGLVFEDHRLECFLVSDVPRKDKSGAYEEGDHYFKYFQYMIKYVFQDSDKVSKYDIS